MTGDPLGWTGGSRPVLQPEDLTRLVAAASDMAFLIGNDGHILSVLSDTSARENTRILGWTGRRMQDFLTVESVPKFESALAEAGGTSRRLVELNHVEEGGWGAPVRYSLHPVGMGGTYLMLGQDLRQVAETQAQLVQAQIALERGYEKRREHDARYRILMAMSREAFLFLSSDGQIRDANPAAASLLESPIDSLIDSPVDKVLKLGRAGDLTAALVTASEADADLTLQARLSPREIFVAPRLFRAAGEKLILCRLATAGGAPLAEDQTRQDLQALFRKTTDGVVFCDKTGVITEANEAFLDLADIPSLSDVKGRSLGDFLDRGQVDLSVLLDNTAQAGHMRTYVTRLANDLGAQATVEMSSVALTDSGNTAFGFVLRDADRAMAMRQATRPGPGDEAPNHNVVELVGSATLKEIVAETSDVIEKMCIETAVELTRNNRAAAAEMLGVSRQSLYVKLRKYGLIKREDD